MYEYHVMPEKAFSSAGRRPGGHGDDFVPPYRGFFIERRVVDSSVRRTRMKKRGGVSV